MWACMFVRACVSVCMHVYAYARAKKEHQNITTSISPISLIFFFNIFSRKDGCLSCPNYDVMAVIIVYRCRGDTELLSSVYWHKPREGSTVGHHRGLPALGQSICSASDDEQYLTVSYVA